MSEELVNALRAGGPYLRLRELPLCALLFEDAAAEIERLSAELTWMTEHRDERTTRLFEANQRAEKAEESLENWKAAAHLKDDLYRRAIDRTLNLAERLEEAEAAIVKVRGICTEGYEFSPENVWITRVLNALDRAE